MNDAAQALIDECERQSEGCGYTSTTFIIWLRVLRWVRTACLVLPVICGALATWQILNQRAPLVAALCTFLATTIPLAYRASKTDAAIEDYAKHAGEYTNLRDAFRQAAKISSHKPFAEFEAETKPLIKRLETVRRAVLTPPNWAFLVARSKHKAGHYRHDYDEQNASGAGNK